MLGFAAPPDRIFMSILKESFEIMIDQITKSILAARYAEKEKDSLQYILPLASRVFNAETARNTLKRMLACHKRPGLYHLNDYHFLLLYDTLHYYCEIRNDMVASAEGAREKERISRIGGFNIERLEADEIVGIYFFDTDFLMDPETMIEMGIDRRKQLGINNETFGISQGLAPHPEELKIKIVRDEKAVLIMQSVYFGPSSRVYPDMEWGG